MELEVFEPLMFLSYHPEAPARFARAIEKRLLRGLTAARDPREPVRA